MKAGDNYEEVWSIPRVARLQFESVNTWGNNFQVDYELIIPLVETDCRGTYDHKGKKTRPKNHRLVWLDSDNCRHIPMGRTEVQASRPDYPFVRGNEVDRIDLPFRDGAHVRWDNEHFNFPVYYIAGGRPYLLKFKKES